MEVGRSIPRVDAADKVTGRAKYTDDLCPRPVLEAKILHSTIANGWVKSMDISAAQALPGVVKVLTCFDVPDIQYPTPGHPWSVEKAHQDVSDRKLLNRRVRIYGDDIAAVVAEDEITARRALELIRVEYEEYPVVLEAEHLCMSMRGVKKAGAKTTTSAVRGAFERSQATRAEALSLIFARRD